MYKEKWWAVALQLHIVFPGVVNFCKCKKKRVWKKNTEFQEVLQTILKHNVYPGCLHSESSQGKSLIGISTSYGNQDPAVEMIGWAYEVEVLSVFKLVYPVLSYLSLSLESIIYSSSYGVELNVTWLKFCLKGHDRIPNMQRCFIPMISENEMPTIYFVFD